MTSDVSIIELPSVNTIIEQQLQPDSISKPLNPKFRDIRLHNCDSVLQPIVERDYECSMNSLREPTNKLARKQFRATARSMIKHTAETSIVKCNVAKKIGKLVSPIFLRNHGLLVRQSTPL